MLPQSLLRPIISYACQIWFHVEPSTMEDIRRFARRCLRLCHGGAYRSQESGFIKYVTNKKLYDKLNIPRIDNFIISLIMNHIARSGDIVENTLISGPLLSIDVRYAKNVLLRDSSLQKCLHF